MNENADFADLQISRQTAKNSLSHWRGVLMSDDSIFGLIIGIAIMFFGLGITPFLAGRRGQLASIILGVLALSLALGWSTIKTHIGPELHLSLSAAASNAYVWLGMLAITWAYLAFASLSRPRNTKRFVPYIEPDRILPESLQSDADVLVKKLGKRGLRAQILYANGEKSVRLANELSEIFNRAEVAQPGPPMQIAPEVQMKKGITVRSSHTDPSDNSGTVINLALMEIGIDAYRENDASLRRFDHCFVYIVQ
jgi:hypothetical protein